MQIRIDIPEELNARREHAIAETGKTLEQLTREALLGYLEDREDYQLALEGLKSAETEGTVSLEEVVRKLGLEIELTRAAERQMEKLGEPVAGQIATLPS